MGFIGTSIIVATFSNAGIANAMEYKKEGWPIPDLTGSKFLGERNANILSDVPGNESIESGYRTRDGNYVHQVKFKGKTFGYFIDINKNYPLEETILDDNGDGIFTHKYQLDEVPPTPSFIKSENSDSKD